MWKLIMCSTCWPNVLTLCSAPVFAKVRRTVGYTVTMRFTEIHSLNKASDEMKYIKCALTAVAGSDGSS